MFDPAFVNTKFVLHCNVRFLVYLLYFIYILAWHLLDAIFYFPHN